MCNVKCSHLYIVRVVEMPKNKCKFLLHSCLTKLVVCFMSFYQIHIRQWFRNPNLQIRLYEKLCSFILCLKFFLVQLCLDLQINILHFKFLYSTRLAPVYVFILVYLLLRCYGIRAF